MQQIKTVWFEEGYVAYQNKQSIESCPYKAGTYGYAQWIKGFNKAKRESQCLN